MPYVGGALALMPVMLYIEWRHKVQTGLLTGPFSDFLLNRNQGFSPIWFGALGYHLWFLGFLFSFSILCLPAFQWLKGDRGRPLTSFLASLAEHRSGLLMFIIPLAAIRLALQPFYPKEHDWADFFVLMTFFLFGFVLFSREAFLQAIRRDWLIHLVVAIGATALGMGIVATTGSLDVLAPPRSALDILFWVMVVADGWCMSLVVMFLGMRYLNFTNSTLAYWQQAILPFFVLHQPVIILLAYFVVQWPAALAAKLLVVILGSFLVTLGIYEFTIRRVGVLRLFFGMKDAPTASASY
jgi:hypothetical protein